MKKEVIIAFIALATSLALYATGVGNCLTTGKAKTECCDKSTCCSSGTTNDECCDNGCE
jgi:hypothetical protein